MMNITTSKWRFLKILPPPLSSMSDWEFSWNKSSILGYFHLWNPHGGGNLMEFANLGKPGAWALPQSWPWGARVVKNICFWIHIYIFNWFQLISIVFSKLGWNRWSKKTTLMQAIYEWPWSPICMWIDNSKIESAEHNPFTQCIYLLGDIPSGGMVHMGHLAGSCKGGPPNHPSHVFSFTGKHGGKKQHFEKHTWWI